MPPITSLSSECAATPKATKKATNTRNAPGSNAATSSAATTRISETAVSMAGSNVHAATTPPTASDTRYASAWAPEGTARPCLRWTRVS